MPSAAPDLASLSWHRLADTGQFSDPVGSVMITGLTALPNGSLLAIGNGPAGGVVWRSTDGVAWQHMPLDPALRLAHLLNVVPFRGAVELVGDIASVNGKVRPGLWSSVDGLLWMAIPLPAGYAASGPLTAAGDRLYLAGDSTSSSGELMPALWTSTDARTWARVDDVSIQGAVVTNVANGPAGPVIVGTVDSQGSVFATAWHSSAGGLAAVTMSEPSALASSVDQVIATSTGYIATGSQTTGDPNAPPTAAVWRSSDGVSWVESHAGIPDGAVLGPVATDGTSFVLEGNLDERPGLWASTEGTRWSQLSGADRLAAGGQTAVAALLATPGRVLAVGSASGPVADAGMILAGLPSATSVTDWTSPFGRPAACMGTPVDIAAIVARPRSDRLRCFGARTLHLRAWVAESEGLGGTTPYVGTPAWLNDPFGYGTFLQAVEAPFGQGTLLVGHLRPGVRFSRVNVWVKVTGHFDDPAARTCRTVSTDPTTPPPSRTATIARCRSEFVITAIARTSAP